jgi:ABC-type dipeptide/oligopeptide/nickel transport system permease subunit
MTIAQLITLAVCVLAFALGRYSGYHQGIVDGRKAVRKYYESLQANR